MLAVNLLDQTSISALRKWQLGKQQQAILSTPLGKVFVFHGTTDISSNLNTVVKYRKLIMKADKLVCCHAQFFPEWIQNKCITVGTGTVTVTTYGDSVMYLKQN